MSIILTGGTGKTSTILSTLLSSTNPPTPHLLLSRHAPSSPSTTSPQAQHIPFSWSDPTTHSLPFTHQSPTPPIKAIYLIAPQIPNPSPCMISFISLAIANGVKRFVLLTGSLDEMTGGVEGGIGEVWKYLHDLQAKEGGGVEYTILRATWFMENFLVPTTKSTIQNESKIYSACGNGLIPFVSAEDIAAVALHALTSSSTPQENHRILGPELLSFDDIASHLSLSLSRPIQHIHLTPQESAQRYETHLHLPRQIASFMSMLEHQTSLGAEERVGDHDDVEEVTGRKPMSFDAWLVKNRGEFV